MPEDIVIDTNVLVHAGNPGVDHFEPALQLLEWLSQEPVAMCTDPGWSMDEARNRSHIMSEYFEHLRFGSPGMAVVRPSCRVHAPGGQPQRGSQAEADGQSNGP